MPLPTPSLDDRRFQDIVDELKRRIPLYCPEWTDHNVSDPGVAILELFAWLTESILFRMNQVPDKVYIKFLEMLGKRLDPPQAAVVPLTFYLVGPQDRDVYVGEGVEVATRRIPGEDPTIFSTEQALRIRPPAVEVLVLFRQGRGSIWSSTVLPEADKPDTQLLMFSDQPRDGDALHISLQADVSRHVLKISTRSVEASGSNINPKDPPIIWEAYGRSGWIPCDVLEDTTGGFNYLSGYVILLLPDLVEHTLEDTRSFWVRCRAVKSPGSMFYLTTPELLELRVDTIGATVLARHGSIVRDELLGLSDGRVDQKFRLLHTPALPRDPLRGDVVVVREPNGNEEIWEEVERFGKHGANDRVCTIDSVDGTVAFAPAIRQPDGSMRLYGAVPPARARIIMRRYRYGGGIRGNVKSDNLVVLRSAIPYIKSVTNHTSAVGGRDAESIEDAKLHAPDRLMLGDRAIVREDYETFAMAVEGVSQVRALSYEHQLAHQVPYGTVRVVVLPADRAAFLGGRENFDDLRAKVLADLSRRAPFGIRVEVALMRVEQVTVEVELAAPDASAEEAFREQLSRWYSPWEGQDGKGWPAGKGVQLSELYRLAGTCNPTLEPIKFRLWVQREKHQKELHGRIDVEADTVLEVGLRVTQGARR